MKKINKNKNSGDTNFRTSFFKVIKMFIVVIVIFGLFYLLTIYLLNKPSNSTSTSNATKVDTTISYKEILAGSSFDIDGEYLVIYYDQSDEELKSTITSLISTYEDKENHKNVYTVDMSSALNSKYLGDLSNTNPSSINDLKINGSTMIIFKDGKVDKYIEGKDDITNYFNS